MLFWFLACVLHPAITMDNSNIQSDMAEYFDFGEAAMPDVPQDHTVNVEVPTIVSTGRSLCPAHGTDSTDGLVHLFS